jgi:hypothetical protein
MESLRLKSRFMAVNVEKETGEFIDKLSDSM